MALPHPLENYYLKFFIKGSQSEFIYPVDKVTQNRIKKCLLDNTIVNSDGFISFETAEGQHVKVKPSCIQLCQFLWDIGKPVKEEDKGYNLLFLLKDRPEPIVYYCQEDEEIAEIIEELEAIEFRDEEQLFFLKLTDEDGEMNLICANDVILFESGCPDADSFEGMEEMEEFWQN